MRSDDADRVARGEDLEFRTARTGLVLLLMISAGLAVLGLCLVGGGDGLVRMLGIAVVAFFGLVGIPLIGRRLVRPELALTVSAERGVWIDRGPWIPWADIRSVDREVVAARPSIVLRLDPAGYQSWAESVTTSGGSVEPVPGDRTAALVPQTIAAPTDRIFAALATAYTTHRGQSRR